MEPRPKISKHLSNRLPDVFMQPRTIGLREKKQPLDPKPEADRSKVPAKVQAPPQQPKAKNKKSRNPFLPMHEWFKLSKVMADRINQARQGFEPDRFSKFSFEGEQEVGGQRQEAKEQKSREIKYEECLTLNVEKKNHSGCLKKILHVPTVGIYFLRESLIDLSIDKHDLEQWIKKCNAEAQKKQYEIKPQKIIQLYWNTPENYYSIIYEYVEGTLFEPTLENLNTFPTAFIQNLALAHLRAEFQIYNSQLIIKRNARGDIAYLPIYEEIDDVIPHQRNFRELMKIDSIGDNQSSLDSMEQKMSARLGFLVLISYFGDALTDEDISNILFSSPEQCCLIHKLISQQSLIGLSLQQNIADASAKEKEHLVDFLCRCLKYNPKSRAKIGELRHHKFLTSEFSSEASSIWEIMNVLESTGAPTKSVRNNPTRELSLHKLNKVLDSISLILQGSAEHHEIDFSSENETIKYLARQLGLGTTESDLQMAVADLNRKLKKIYSANS